jgi:glycosyltransferase involved in cell wall biosynthesis
MTSAHRALCVSFGHLDSLDAGLGEFARRLGERLAQGTGVLRDAGVRLVFHLQPRLRGAFGDGVEYVAYEPSQRWRPWRLPHCALWHSAFQHNATRPPEGSQHRLLTVHDLNFRYAKTLGSWRDSAVTRLAVSRSNGIATISRYVADDLRSHLSWRGGLRTIYNGASNLVGLPQEPVPSLHGRSFFFHLSRMAASKNVGALVELARAWPEKTFVFAGPAWGDSKRLHDTLQGTLPNVQFLLGISEAVKAWLLQHCQAFLFPSLAEGFGLPPIEAMHFGTPVFLSDRTCLPEIGGRCAGYFHEFSPAAMRAVIESELPRLASFREATQRHAAQFDWDRCAEGYLDWYSERLSIDLGARPVLSG